MSFERRFAEMVREHRNVALAEGIELGGDRRSRDIAIQMLKAGFPLGQVAQMTMLSLEDVARLELELRRDGRLDG